jgi:hypothetical protein
MSPQVSQSCGATYVSTPGAVAALIAKARKARVPKLQSTEAWKFAASLIVRLAAFAVLGCSELCQQLLCPIRNWIANSQLSLLNFNAQ